MRAESRPVGADHFAQSNVVDLARAAPPNAGPPNAVGHPSEQTGQPPGPAQVRPFVVDATDATFSTLIEQSKTVPVVVDLWASWCEPCKQLGPILEKLVGQFGGRLLLAKVDIDANQQIAQAFAVQSIPLVIALVAGQPVPLFQGAQGEPQVRAVLTELLNVAAKNGVNGTLTADAGPGATESVEPPLPPLHIEAVEAIKRGDYAAATAAYSKAVAETPGDTKAKIGLAQVGLLSRVDQVDNPEAVLAAAAAAPKSPEAALVAADVEVATGRPNAAFDRLVALIRALPAAEREPLRLRLVDYFDIVGIDAPEVITARRALASALF